MKKMMTEETLDGNYRRRSKRLSPPAATAAALWKFHAAIATQSPPPPPRAARKTVVPPRSKTPPVPLSRYAGPRRPQIDTGKEEDMADCSSGESDEEDEDEARGAFVAQQDDGEGDMEMMFGPLDDHLLLLWSPPNR